MTAAIAGADAVVHLAGIVGDPACAAEPGLAKAVNLDATIALHDACLRAGVARFVFASTCAVTMRAGTAAIRYARQGYGTLMACVQP